MNTPTPTFSDDDGEVLLQTMLNASLDDFEERVRSTAVLPAAPPTDGQEQPGSKTDKETHSQWALGGNGRFMPVGATAPKLPAGIYEPFAVPGMWGLEQLAVASDGIYILPDMATEIVLAEVKKFWLSEEKYRAHKLLYKRGLMLWGPPGGGKTVAVKLIMNELVKQDGIVITASNISLSILCLKAIRRIEPKRNLIVVFEDIDEIINYNGEAGVLSMLDGENNVDNVLHLACPAPETRVLMADLSWKRADKLSVGEEIIAFDETAPKSVSRTGGLGRAYRTAVVEACPIIKKPRYKVTTDQGSIVVSENHPFLVKIGAHPHSWRFVQNLKKGNRIASLGKPWESSTTYDAGYVAGQLDGEGSMNFTKEGGTKHGFSIRWAQTPNASIAAMKNALSNLGMKIGHYYREMTGGGTVPKATYKPQNVLSIIGGKWESLKLIGMTQPKRLLANPRLRKAWEGSRIAPPSHATVISVEYIGEGDVVALGTSTKTFIGEGLFQHNTTNYPDKLGPRIINRPSRFDRRVHVGMPSDEARKVYLQRATNDGLSQAELEKWVAGTKEMSIAHLRELVAATYCLEQPYEEVIERLKKMAMPVKSEDGFKSKKMGYTPQAATVSSFVD